MSFLPVSEALLRLEFEGLLESRPRAGTRVRIPSPDDVRGHYLVRETLEDASREALRGGGFAVGPRRPAEDGGAGRRCRARSTARRTSASTTSSTAASLKAPGARCCRRQSSRPARCRPRGSACSPGRRRTRAATASGPREGARRRHPGPGGGRHAAARAVEPPGSAGSAEAVLRDAQGERQDVLAKREAGRFMKADDDRHFAARAAEARRWVGAASAIVPAAALVTSHAIPPRARGAAAASQARTRAARNADRRGIGRARGDLRAADSDRRQRARRRRSARRALHRSRAGRRAGVVAAGLRVGPGGARPLCDARRAARPSRSCRPPIRTPS